MRRHENHKYTEAISYQIEGSTRVDPHDLTKYFNSADIREKAAELTGIADSELFGSQVPGMVQFKANHIMVACSLNSGLPLIVRVPISYYEGIGARFVVGKRDGNPLVCILELVHKDPGLTIPLMVSTDLEDAAVDWKSWSRRFNLTMLHQPLGMTGLSHNGAESYRAAELDGESLSGLFIAKQKPRRHHAQFAARRPRFLSRRKIGDARNLADMTGREIIARS